MLKLLKFADVPAECSEPVDPKALEQARTIVNAIRTDGEKAMLEFATKFGDVKEGELWYADKEELKAAYDTLDADKRDVLSRVGARIRKFAKAQRASISDVETDIPGGKAGQLVTPVENAGCYAPGGRYPLPSSVLMTAITAREAGVKNVWVASPHPDQVTKAAAHVAGADGMLKIGGAQAIATMAEGMGPVPAANIIVGPGNQWVTAAKSLVQGRCAIDMLAGPSEVLVIADETADPKVVAADLIAQAEHDVESRPILVTTHAPLHALINAELATQIKELPSPNKETATAAMSKGFCIVAASIDEAVSISDSIAPEHLEIMTAHPTQVGMQCNHYGGLFLGKYAAEVLGDYGVGPNHVLPTAGTAKYTGGLSVHTFLRIRTWMRVDEPADAQEVVVDSIALARMEGLEGHARAAEARKL
mmetsp:Transcript_22092/g.53001  ORF Transcript_22092/g.53001 Transcript_22092/m.53001 type:complete len:420 (+) Transcript_22092:59-1318(+)